LAQNEKNISVINGHMMAIAEASRNAHYAALKAIEQLKKQNKKTSKAEEIEQVDESSDSATEEEEEEEESKDQSDNSTVEFEIDQEFIEFYKKSHEYKLEKRRLTRKVDFM
jgi:hypothetical protein